MASRGGKKATQALDHDTQQKQKLVPFGILDVVAGLLTILVGTSRDTSDFIVDCLQQWWDENEDRYGTFGSWSSTWTMVPRVRVIARSS